MRRASLWCIVGVMLLWTGAADADPQHLNELLQGDDVSTGESTCLVALPPGFNPNLTPIDGRFTFSSSTQGIRTFNGDGTGTGQSRSVSVTHPDTPVTLGGASSSDTNNTSFGDFGDFDFNAMVFNSGGPCQEDVHLTGNVHLVTDVRRVNGVAEIAVIITLVQRFVSPL